MIFTFICAALIVYDWQASVITIVLMSSVGFFLLRITNNRLKKWGKKRQFHASLALKQLQQSFSGIKEIILNGLENVFLDRYHFQNKENAVFINEKNYEEKFKEFLESTDNPEWEQIANSGREHVLKNFSNDVAVNSLVELFIRFCHSTDFCEWSFVNFPC